MTLLKIIKHIIIIIAIGLVVWAVFAILFGLPTIGLLYLFNFDIQNFLLWGFIVAILFASYWYQKAKEYQRELEYYKNNGKKEQSK